MPVPLDDIEKDINTISLILDNYKRLCLIDKEGVDYYLHALSNNFAGLLDQKMSLSIEYLNPIVQLIKKFYKINILMPQELNNALCNILLNFDHNYEYEVLQDTVNECIKKLDILGEDSF
ncbi:MAG TPA: hypothetical protein LFW21_00230 [Rickettsia endosymbiont of Pyrocoelia pectoralis]|nr:hypothetical protein [Rickettsia endosymbiont of Pyrocoelia pectoralis]